MNLTSARLKALFFGHFAWQRYAPRLAATIVFSLLATSVLPAQQRLAFAVTGSSAFGNGGDYKSRDHLAGGQISVARRQALAPHLGWVVQLEADVTALTRAEESVCLTQVGTSGCRLAFPTWSGVNVTAGLLAIPIGRLELTGTGGGGLYRGGGKRVAVFVGETTATLYLFDAIGITIGRKVLLAPSFKGDRLSTTSWLLGARLRTN